MDVEKMVENVARAIRRGKFVRTGRAGCFDEGLPLTSAELSDGRAAIRAVLGGIDTTDAAMVERMLDAYWGQADTDDAPMDHAPMQTAATAYDRPPAGEAGCLLSAGYSVTGWLCRNGGKPMQGRFLSRTVSDAGMNWCCKPCRVNSAPSKWTECCAGHGAGILNRGQ